jgi:hypothetical protein
MTVLRLLGYLESELRIKKWVTTVLKKSSTVKNCLCRKWIQSKNPNDEIRYKKYRNIFRKVADAADKSFYKNMFDVKINSVRQLWNNLNEVFSCNLRCVIVNNKKSACNLSC